MKKELLASAAVVAAVLVSSAPAMAQAPAPAPAEPKPSYTLTGNMTIATDYRFRGISQTFGAGFFSVGPAIQGGIDWAHESGFYLGNWNSNVSGNTFPNGSSIEMDFYGGWKKTWDDWGLDVGTIYYLYPNAKYPSGPTNPITGRPISFTSNTNNWELYVGGSWKWFGLKYFYAVTDYFGLNQGAIVNWIGCNPSQFCLPQAPNGDTKGTQYLTGTFSYEIMPKLTLGASIGYTWLRHYNAMDYFDYKVGVTYDLAGWLLGANLVGTDADKKYWYADNSAGTVRDVGTFGLVLSVGRTF